MNELLLYPQSFQYLKKGLGVYNFRMLTCHEGLDGSGKTYAMAEHALRMIAKGRDCFGTFSVEGMRTIEDARQMIKIEHAFLYFDEWHQDLDARQWYNLDPVIRHMVSQHRHYHLTIQYSSQSFFFMDPFIRRETTFVWQHEALWRDPDSGESRPPWPFHKMHRHRKAKFFAREIELKHRNPKALEGKSYWLNPKIYTKYDSFKKVILSSKHVSDIELETIKDPYLIAPIMEISLAQPREIRRDVSSLKDALIQENKKPEGEPSELNLEQNEQDGTGSIEGEEPTKNIDGVMEDLKPRERRAWKLIGGR